MVRLAPGNNTIYVTVIIPIRRFCRDDYHRDPQIALDGRANRSPGVSPWTWLGRQAHRRGSYYQLDPQQCASAGTKIRPRLSRGGSGHVAALEDTENELEAEGFYEKVGKPRRKASNGNGNTDTFNPEVTVRGIRKRLTT